MAIPREMLEKMGLTEEQVSQVIAEHSNTVSFLEGQRNEQKRELEGVINKLQKELDNLKSGNWEAKYNKEHESFEQYRKDVETKARIAKTKELYVQLLKETGIVGEDYLKTVCNVTKFNDMVIGENGELENKEALAKEIIEKYPGMLAQEKVKGAEVQTPPVSGVDMTKEGFFNLSGKERMEYANNHSDWKEFYK